MADMDGFKEAAAYGLDKPQKSEQFFLKGNENQGWGVKNRLARIFNPKTGHTVMLACDHGFIMGPTSGLERVDLTINPLIEYADCLMCTRGILRSVIPPSMSKPVCLRSDGGTTILTDLNLNRVYDVEDVIRLNVSAMAVMVACGDKASEQITTHNLVHTVDMGAKYGIPVLGVTAVGKDMARDARYFGLATRVDLLHGGGLREGRRAVPGADRDRGRQEAARGEGPRARLQGHPGRRRRRGHGPQRVPEREAPRDDEGDLRRRPPGPQRAGRLPALQRRKVKGEKTP